MGWPSFEILHFRLVLLPSPSSTVKDEQQPFVFGLSAQPAEKMRLTADLINSSLSYLNPNKERELDLRGAFLERADTTL
jgi:hypothetical protein